MRLGGLQGSLLLGLSSGFDVGKGDGACASQKLDPSELFPEIADLDMEKSSVYWIQC